ncbi:hypothetical protein EIP91_008604 [Steccherinum ochraceum]|uniref:P-loop containing nucleoside triphosphate hydrolase protein n=1 Tax=Steccherinum ochraceum TaxID=92696 RepID=A0A4R0RY52_9APHY|nr:hypothetical protein EIP91_008604 [Steccherinum ochraceum]
MDSVDLVQTVLSTFAAMTMANGNSTRDNATVAQQNTTSSPLSHSQALPAVASTILSMLLSYSALRDWAKLLIIGSVIETCRRVVMNGWQTLHESVWISASFEEDDSSYNWILHWFSSRPQWRNARTVDVSTRPFGLIPGIRNITEDDKGEKPWYLPSLSETYTVWYKGHYVRLTRRRQDEGVWGGHREILQLSILALRRGILNELLTDAMDAYKTAQEHLISIYVNEASGGDYWRCSTTRPKRPLNSIILDPGIKDLLLNDARDFLNSRSWYQARGIPFRRGYLLHGAPGSGKTSMIHSIAGELDLNVYVISLSRTDDSSLAKLLGDLPDRCIILMEDIDAAFRHGISRNSTPDDKTTPANASKGNHADQSHDDGLGTGIRVTLSGLLNALDGVAAQEGRLLFATTNFYGALDPALSRPGRMDLHVEFKLASKYQAAELFKCFYLPEQNDSECSPYTDTPSNSEIPARSDITDDDQKRDPPTEKTILLSSPMSSDDSPIISGTTHGTRAPKLSRQEITQLSSRFAEAIPERMCSMASLQCYLMTYKTRPEAAVLEAAAWVEAERSKKRRATGDEAVLRKM